MSIIYGDVSMTIYQFYIIKNNKISVLDLLPVKFKSYIRVHYHSTSTLKIKIESCHGTRAVEQLESVQVTIYRRFQV